MTFADRLQEVRTGFDRPFWVANVTEMFERLSYYGSFAVLATYLADNLRLGEQQAGNLAGFFGGFVWFMAVFGGALADRMGFRRALALAYFILASAYFLLGSITSAWISPIRDLIGLVPLLFLILALPALGVALVKPVIVGTTARASRENVRSIGYSIYYTMVNIGSALGPFMASAVADLGLPTEYVFRVAAASVFIMLVAVLIFFKEPARTGEEAASIGAVVRNFGAVVTNGRFMLFLLIFSGYWIVFWQEFILLPRYIKFFVLPGVAGDVLNATTSRVLSAGPITVIAGTLLVNFLTRRIPALPAIALGTLITSLAWVIVALQPTITMAVVTLVVVALGEIIQSPRYYEYISRLAPPGQQGTYMGFAFLPIGIGSLVGGPLGGYLMHRYGEVQQRPEMIWWIVTAIGVLTAVLLFIYDRIVQPMKQETPA